MPIGKRIIIHSEGGYRAEGILVKTGGGKLYLATENSSNILIVYEDKIILIKVLEDIVEDSPGLYNSPFVLR